MNDDDVNPVRLKERHDQSNLVERIAGQAVRDLPEPPQLSPRALARIEASIEERATKPYTFRFGRVLAVASLVLGLVTVASAARLDRIQLWIAKITGIERKPAAPAIPRVAKSWNAVRKADTPKVSPVVELPQAPKDVAQPSPAPVSVPIVAAEPLVAPRGTLAKATATESPRGLGRGRPSISHDRVHGNGVSPRIPGGDESSRLAIRSIPEEPAPRTEPSFVGETRPSPLPVQAPERAGIAPSPTVRSVPASPPVLAPAAPAAAPGPTHNPSARYLKDIVHTLRVARAPRSALELLDRHASDLERNAFAEEALLLRIEAMLALRQHREALGLLDGVPLANVASSSVLLVTRGQLRANANRCEEAVADFDLALSRAVRPIKQALQGRAQCKQKLGDTKAADADRETLVREFPDKPGP